MRLTPYLIPVLLLALAGCGKKEEAAAEPTATPPTKSSSIEPTAEAGDLKSKVIGEWTMVSEQGNTKVDAEIVIREDGTFTNAGTMTSETPGEDATITIKASYSMDGKWTVEGDSIATTPDSVDAKIDELDIVAKDPANQAALDAQKEESSKKAEEQMKDSMNKPSKSKVESATEDKIVLDSGGAKVEYNRKK